jgi:transcriptional regulator with XRE-family HTH domain
MKNENFQLTSFTKEENLQIGERLAILRNDILHLSQLQCADALGISQTYLSLLESGKRKITPETVLLYVEHFNVNAEWLLNGNDSQCIIGNEPRYNADYYIHKKQQDSLISIKDAYHLDKTEMDFLSRFLSQEPAKRKRFLKTLNDLKDFL